MVNLRIISICAALFIANGDIPVLERSGLLSADDAAFEQFQKEFDVAISDAEYDMRKGVFQTNVDVINQHNLGDSEWKMGLTPFSHLTDEEFNKLLTLFPKEAPTKKFRPMSTPKPDISNLPKNVDWREKGIITPVKNQGMCGSCWAFGATQSVESAWATKTGTLEILAPQQMVECTANPRQCGGSGGCQGATEQLGMQTIIDMGGMARESDYPYTSGTGTWKPNLCKKKPDGTLLVPAAAHIDEIVQLEPNSYEHVLYHIATHGPLSVALDATPLSRYKRGVFDGCPKGASNVNVNHAVQLVGYGENDTDGKYWIVRNSWSTYWGENGYMRLRRTEPGSASFCGWNRTPQNGSLCIDEVNKPQYVCGPCGILSETQYPVIKD